MSYKDDTTINCGSLPRRHFLQTSVLAGVSAAAMPTLAGARDVACPAQPPEIKPFELDEITIADLQAGLASGKFTARSITEKYLARIEEIDKQGPAINSVIEVNPEALAIADALDKEHNPRTRPHARHPGPDQRQYRHRRSNADDGGFVGFARLEANAGFICCAEVARIRRGNSGQDQSQRVGEHSLQPFQQRMERARRPDPQSLRPRP